MRLVILFLAASIAFAQSGWVSGGQSNYLSYTHVSSPSFGAYYADLRYEGPCPDTKYILRNNAINVQCSGTNLFIGYVDENTTIDLTSFATGGGNYAFRLRVIRRSDGSGGLLYLWKPDGSGRISATEAAAYTGAYGWGRTNINGDYNGTNPPSASSGAGGTLHFFRVYAGAPADPTKAPADAVTTPGDLFNIELDGATTAGAGWTLSASSGGSFAASSLTDPIVSFALNNGLDFHTTKAGTPYTLTYTGFAARATDGTPSILGWNIVDSPLAGSAKLNTYTGSTAQITCSQFGDHTVRLTAADSTGVRVSGDVRVGCVPVDSRNIVVQTNPTLETVIGPVPFFGAVPWTWAEWTDVGNAIAQRYWYNQAWVEEPATTGTWSTATAQTYGTVENTTGTQCGGGPCRFFSTGFVTFTPAGGGASAETLIGSPASACLPAGGSSTAYTCTVTGIGSLTDGLIIAFKPDVTCTGTPSLNVNSYGVKTIRGPMSGENELSPIDSAKGWCRSTYWTKLKYEVATDSFRLVAHDYMLNWNAPSGTGNGRYRAEVTIQDGTFVIPLSVMPIPVAQMQGITLRPVSTANALMYSHYVGGGEPGDGTNYYEAILALARLWQATGLSVFRDDFRTYCNNHWKYAANEGYTSAKPRNAGLHLRAACAADNHPEWWDSMIYAYRGLMQAYNPTSTRVTTDAGQDLREEAYVLRGASNVILATTNADHKTELCTYVKNWITNTWDQNYFEEDGRGYWPENLEYYSLVVYGRRGNGKWGASAWRGGAMSGIAYDYARRAMLSCGETALAATMQTKFLAVAQWLYDIGRYSDGGMFYGIGNTSQSASAYAGDDFRTATSITVTNGSTTVTGVGSSFQTWFTCDGNDYFVPLVPNGEREVWRVASCQSQTQITLTAAYSKSTQVVTTIVLGRPPDTSCAPSLWTGCDKRIGSGVRSTRDYSHNGSAVACVAYYLSGNPTYQTQCEYWSGKALGGPALGPWTTVACAGPQCDGDRNNAMEGITNCTATGNAAPCCVNISGGCSGTNRQSKYWGETSGYGDYKKAFALYLGGPVADPLSTITLQFVLPSGATKNRVSVRKPNGATAQTVCNSSPCSVGIDGRLGKHSVKYEYLTAGDVLVASGDWQQVR